MIEIDVIVSDEVSELLPFDAGRIKKHAVNVFESSEVSESDVNIVFIDDENMMVLNEKYKGRKGPTDVLSFALSEEDTDRIEGEIYVSLERAKEQSVEYDVSYAEEVVRLITHGLLHLTGRVHRSDEEYKAMVEDTEKIVKSFFANGELM